MNGVVAVDPLTAWVVGDSNAGYATIYNTTDGGLTWNRMGSAAQVPDTGLLKVATFGYNNIWAVGSGAILHSSDGGATWANQIPAGYGSVFFQGVYTPDGVNVWATGGPSDGYATILKSSDGGLTWTRQSGGDVGLLGHVLGISAVNANTAWAMGATADSMKWSVLATTNGGLTWNGDHWHPGRQQCLRCGCLDGLGGLRHLDPSDYQRRRQLVFDLLVTARHRGNQRRGFPAGMGRVHGAYGTIMHTTNGGNSWVTLTQLDGENLPGLSTVSFSGGAVPEPSSVACWLSAWQQCWACTHYGIMAGNWAVTGGGVETGDAASFGEQGCEN